MLYTLALLLPCTVSLFGALWLFCNRKSNTRAQNILTLSLLLSSVFYFCTANYIVGVPDYVTYRWLDIMDCFITPFIIPTMYLYFRALTDEGPFTWREYIWFLPSLVLGIGTFVSYLAMDEAEVAEYITSVFINKSPGLEYTDPIYRMHHLFSIELYTSISLVQVIGTATGVIINLKRYHHRLREFHSGLDDNIYLDNALLIWFLAIIPFTFGIILIEETFWQEHLAVTSLYFTAYSGVYFGILYYGSQKKYTVENLAEDLQQADLEAMQNKYDSEEEEEIENDEGKMADAGRYARHLVLFNKLIEEDLIFLQSDLRADELASKMRTNRTYLSRMLKEEFQCTFSDYINRQRIEYSQKVMRANPDVKLAELAESSGFINVNSFGRTFKQFAGLPPKEWLKKHVLYSELCSID